MIRKQDVIQMLDEWADRLDDSYVSEAIECVLLMVKNKIENMPEQNVWIPCSERLPNEEEYLENDGRFIVTDENRVYEGLFDIYDGMFKKECFGYVLEEDKCVIAWMPLPEQLTFKYEDEESERKQSESDWKESMMGHFTKVE